MIKTFAIALAPIIIILAWPLINSLNAITGKTNHAIISFATIIGSFQILAGSRSDIFSLISLGLFIIGVVWNLCRPGNKKFTVYLIFLSLIQILFVIVARPLGADASHIFSRYIINIEPILLLFVASGIGYAMSKFKKAIPTALIAFLFFYGYYCIPLELLKYNNSEQIFLLGQLAYGKDFEKDIFQKVIKSRPDFYSRLNSYAPGTVSVVEVPYHPDGYYIYAYQLLHHQKVTMGFVNGLCSGDRWGEVPVSTNNTAFSNFVHLANLKELSDRKVDFVVFHKNLHNEVSVVLEHRHLDLSKCIEQYQEWFGNPYFEDDMITVFSTQLKNWR